MMILILMLSQFFTMSANDNIDIDVTTVFNTYVWQFY